ncbi:hypothetical protein NNC19_09770 [Clostridium sp. SHJSY1]|uniref:hypothetical protein n=1 Tax=Clostridium sp. SHJSY1 TaxID=2942483 RepID=UPI002875B48B|nr:hypothetical protein [Clostridium sp. SHJSY1]MDS0525965.1 hypothetical protein [Clostridium sp. SHJSY1]
MKNKREILIGIAVGILLGGFLIGKVTNSVINNAGNDYVGVWERVDDKSSDPEKLIIVQEAKKVYTVERTDNDYIVVGEYKNKVITGRLVNGSTSADVIYTLKDDVITESTPKSDVTIQYKKVK